MGLINAELELANPRDGTIQPINVNSLVDTGSLHLCIPEHVAIQLALEELYKREVTTADGEKIVTIQRNSVTAQIACYFAQEQGESAEFTCVNEHFQRGYWAK